MFINVVKFLGLSILYALITTVVLFALPLLLVCLWLFWPLAELLFGLDLTVLLSVFMTCEHCLLGYSLTIFLVSWAVACIYLTINSLYGGKEEDLTEARNNNGTDPNNFGEVITPDLLAFNPANVQGILTHVDANVDDAENVGMMRASINHGHWLKLKIH